MAGKTNLTLHQIDGKTTSVKSELPPLKSDEVLIRITHSGVCYTDVFYLQHGMALGHEGVGIVEEIGSAVTSFQVGDRAGGGYLRGSCGHCNYCLTGHEIWCYERDIYGEKNFTQGTFADYYVGQETFIYKIPDSIQSAAAAPLQCAGATVYAALTKTIKGGDRVGVVGMGGLGHLAIQFAAKLGAEVVVFSTNESKREEALGFGASEFVLISESDKLSTPINVLVLTGSIYPDFSKFLSKEILARAGWIVPLTASIDPLCFPALKMLFEGYNVHSNLVSDRKLHADMLKFAAHHGISPSVEEFAMSPEGLDEALEKLTKGAVRYRAVLVKQ